MRTLTDIQFWFAQVKVAYAYQMEALAQAKQNGEEVDPSLEVRLQAAQTFILDVDWLIENTPTDLIGIVGQIYKVIAFVGTSLPDVQEFYNSQVGNTNIVIGNGLSIPLASNTIYGKVRLSVAPVLSSDPIAVGDNDPRIISGAVAYDDTIVGATINGAGQLVLTKRDATTITTSGSNILNQTASAQAAGFWINGDGTIEGDFILPSLANDTVVNKFAVFDAQNIMKYVTSEQLLTIIGVGALTPLRVVVSDALGAFTTSAVTTTELGYVGGVTSAIQTQLNNKQPLDADLTAIAALTANGLLRKTAGVWGMDANSYITGNQTITLSGDITGSGTTSILTTIANDAITFAKLQNVNSQTILGRSTGGVGNIEQLTLGVGLALTAGELSSTITQYTDAMARLAISSSASGLSYDNTTGVFTLTAGYSIPTDANQSLWTSAYNNTIVSAGFNTTNGNLTLTQQDGGTIVQDLDGRYLVGNETITLTGDVTGSGTTAIATTIANDAVTFAKFQNVSTGILLGRSTSGSGNIEEISIGTGLTLSAGVLSLGSLATSRALVTSSGGAVTTSTTTATQIGYLDTLSSNAQTQIDGKQPLDATLTALSGVGSSTLGLLVLAGVDTFVTRILEGTTGRISINNANGSGTNPSIDIASTYAGQSSITTIGTITVGAWQGSSIADGYIVSAGAWNEAYDEKINSLGFNTATGIFTGFQQDGGTITVSLDGRFMPFSGGTFTGPTILSGDPTVNLGAATKQYVDNIATGISPKGSVAAATTTTLPSYSGATQTLTGTSNGALAAQDGVTLTLGQYLLVRNESGVNEKYNGIYEVTEVGDGSNPYELTRISTANAWSELVNATVYVAGGSTLQGYTFYQTAPSGGTLGTTAVTWVVFSISTVYLEGSGIDITGSTISVATGGIVDSMVSASAAIALNKLASVTANRVLVSDSSGYVSASGTTTTEIGYVAGVTSAIQTQINNKQPLDATLTALAAFNSNGFMVQTTADTFTSRSIVGTTNRLDVTNGSGVAGNPTLDISATYVGQASITTLGTIGTGVWNGTAIGDTYISSSGNWNTAYNNMIVSASFGTSDGILTLTQQDAGTVTVDLDGRYLLGNETITLSGQATGSGTTSISVTLDNAAVIGKVLTGYVSGAGVIASTDTILQAIQKLNGNIGALVTGVSSVTGTTNRITSSGGSTPVIDISSAYVGQTSITTLGVIGTGTWQGAAIADSYISSATNWNIAYTNRITSLTVTGSSGAATLVSNVLNIPTYTLAGLGGVPTSSISGTSGTVALFGASNTLGNSIITQSGGNRIDLDSSGSTQLRIASFDNTQFRGLVLGVEGDGTEYASFKYKASTGELRIIGSPTGFGGFITFYNNNLEALKITTTNRFITNAATDTGEHFIIGGSARVNGDANITGQLRVNGAVGNINTIFDVKVSTDNNIGIRTGVSIGSFGTAIQFHNDSLSAYTIGAIEASTLLLNSVSGGNVLIGTTTNDGVNKLQVSGSVISNSSINSVGSSALFYIFQSGNTALKTYSKVEGVTIVSYQSDNGAPYTKTTDIVANADSGVASQMRLLTATSGGTPTTALLLSDTGAATFSSSVTATSLIKSGGTASQYLMADGSTSTLTNPVTGTGTTNYLPKFTGASALGNSLIFDNGTSVGIGTTSPSKKLDLQGTMNMNGASGTYLQIQYAGANRGYLGTANEIIPSGSTADFGIAAISNLLFGSGGSLTERMRITSAGNVGIGTTSPAYLLDVNGTARVSGDAYFGTFNGNDKYHFEPFTNLAGGANNAYLLSGKDDNNERSGFVFQARNLNGVEYNAVIIEGYNSTATNTPLTIDSTGAATFSSSVTLSGVLEVNNNAITQDGTRPIVTLKQSGTSKLLLGISAGVSDIIVGDATGDVDFRTNAQAFNFSVDNGGSIAFKLASSGAATFSSSVTASSIIKSGGTSSQFLKADGSVDSSTYLTTSAAATGYIQNQIAAAQASSNAWLSGNLKVNGKVYIGTNGAFFEEVLVGGLYKIQVTDSAGNVMVL